MGEGDEENGDSLCQMSCWTGGGRQGSGGELEEELVVYVSGSLKLP